MKRFELRFAVTIHAQTSSMNVPVESDDFGGHDIKLGNGGISGR